MLARQTFLDIPFVGPLLEISQLRFDYSDSSSDAVTGWLAFLLAVDAVGQIGGFAMLIAGATTTTKKRGPQRIELVPAGAGAAIRGSF